MLAPDGLGLLAALALLHGADGADDAAAAAVDLGDLQADLLLQQLGHRGVLRQAGLGSGDENARALDGDDDAALVLLGDDALDDGAVLLGGLDVGPVLDGVKALLAQLGGALHVVDADHDGLDGVADMDGVLQLGLAVVGELGGGDEGGILRAQVHADLGGGDGHHGSADFVAVIYSLQRILQHLVKGLFLCFFRRGFGRGCFRGGCLFGGGGLFNSGALDARGLFSRDGLGSGRFGRLFYRVLLDQDFIAHLNQYLLDYPLRRRGAGSYAYGVCVPEPRGVELFRLRNELRVGAARCAKLGQVQAVGAVLAANYHHGVALGGQLSRLLLPCGRSRTYCIKYFCVCTHLF